MTLPLPNIAQSVTWRTLEQSRNLAAVNLLSTGLSSDSSGVRHRCLQALVERSEDAGLDRVIIHWEKLDTKDLNFLKFHSKKIGEAAERILSQGSIREKRLALRAISELDLTELVDKFLEFISDPTHPLHRVSADCLLSLCRRLGGKGRLCPGVDDEARQVLVKKLHKHILANSHLPHVMDAWLAVVHWEDAPQRGILQDPGQSAYLKMIARLASTQDSNALQLLAGYFFHSGVPESLVTIIFEKADPMLAVEMALLVPEENTGAVLDKLRNCPTLPCLITVNPLDIDAVPDIKQRLFLMMAASRDDFDWTVSTCVQLSRTGTVTDQQLSAEMLLNCKRPELMKFVELFQNSSILATNEQSFAVTIRQLLGWLDGPSVVLKNAASVVFSDFTVDNLIDIADQWPAPLCRIMAEIVAVTDANSIHSLDGQLLSPAPKKRLAAVRAIDWLECGDLFQCRLLSLINDSSLEIRVSVIDTLSNLNDDLMEDLIPQLLQDPNSDIVDAASRASRRMERLQSCGVPY